MVSLIYDVSFAIALVSLVLIFIRFVKGPTIADRIVSLDMLTVTSISIIAYLAYYFQRIIYLDAALVYGLLSFLGVIAFARYLEGGIK